MIFFTENKIYMYYTRGNKKGSCNDRLKEGVGGVVDRVLDSRLGGHGFDSSNGGSNFSNGFFRHFSFLALVQMLQQSLSKIKK